MKPKFITCNYTDLYGTKLNGRLNRTEVYRYSLRGIAETKENIVCYTGDYDLKETQNYLDSEGICNVFQLNYPLTNSPYYAREMAIKDIKPFYYQDGSWMNRCIEIMFGKFLWMKEHLNSLSDDDYLFWIDAGLANGNIIPRKFNPYWASSDPQYRLGHKLDELKLEFCFRQDHIFNTKFSEKLERFAGEKIMLITCRHQQHNDETGLDWSGDPIVQFPIGGLFGGKKKYLIPFIEQFEKLADQVLESGYLCKEEQIMTYILWKNPDWFKTYQFETWYHEDWDCYNKDMKSFSAFFEDLVNNKLV